LEKEHADVVTFLLFPGFLVAFYNGKTAPHNW